MRKKPAKDDDWQMSREDVPEEGFPKVDVDKAKIQNLVDESANEERPVSKREWKGLQSVLAEYQFLAGFLDASERSQLERIAKKAKSLERAIRVAQNQDLGHVISSQLHASLGLPDQNLTNQLLLNLQNLGDLDPARPKWIESCQLTLEVRLSEWWQNATGREPTVWKDQVKRSHYDCFFTVVAKRLPRDIRPAISSSTRSTRLEEVKKMKREDDRILEKFRTALYKLRSETNSV